MTTFCFKGPSWSYGSWIYNYLCNQCLSSLKLWVGIPLRRCVLDTTLCDKVCQWLAAGRWYSAGTLVSSTYKTYCHDITEILLKVALSAIILTPWKWHPLHVCVQSKSMHKLFELCATCIENAPLLARKRQLSASPNELFFVRRGCWLLVARLIFQPYQLYHLFLYLSKLPPISS